jgi:hypothetical protein
VCVLVYLEPKDGAKRSTEENALHSSKRNESLTKRAAHNKLTFKTTTKQQQQSINQQQRQQQFNNSTIQTLFVSSDNSWPNLPSSPHTESSQSH